MFANRCILFFSFLLPSALAGENVTYVRKANDPAVIQPSLSVRWREYSPDVFKEADRSGKPLFLFVSASWIKAGREMERVTLGEVEVATRLNEEFIPVRIDRDVRPDLDYRLQQAVQAVSGARGWPLCAFVTPNGHVFAGGTFFPADDDPASQKPGLRNVIFQVLSVWRQQKEQVLKAGEALSAAMSKSETRTALTELPADSLSGVAEGYWVERETMQQRPPGSVMLFPAPLAIEAALIVSERKGDARSRQAALDQLDAMLSAGIFDDLGGGFFRCATDGDWRIPRFEKLLVQNAEMLRLLDSAWKISEDGRYRDRFARTMGFLSRDLQAGVYFASALPGGGSDLNDGDAYTWTVREIEDALRNDAVATTYKAIFEIGEQGDLPITAPNRNVYPNKLFRTLDVLKQAEGMGFHGLDGKNAANTLLLAERDLLVYRLKRGPKIQHSGVINVDSNALLAATYLGTEYWPDAGRKILDELLKVGPAHALNSNGKILSPAILSDEAAIALACAAAYQLTGDEKYEKYGVAALERIEKSYLDESDGTFFDRPAGVLDFASVNGRLKLYADTWEPSPIGLAAHAFLTWGTLLDRPTYIMRAKKCVLGCGDIVEGLGHYGATLAQATDWLRNGGVTITIVSKPGAPEAVELFKVAQATYAPWKIVRRARMPENVPGTEASKTAAYASVERNGWRELTSDARQLKAAILKLAQDPK